MENLLIFIAGSITAAIVAILIAKQRCKSVEHTTELRVKNDCDVKVARLESDLANSAAKIAELNKQIEDDKADKEQSLNTQKAELTENFNKLLAEQDKRFTEATDKVAAQMKDATAEMLKQRQEEFSASSKQSIGNILNPLNDTITKMKEEMSKNNDHQIEMKTQMKESVEQMMKQSEAARKSADELANAFRHGNKVQGDWGEVVLKELLESQGMVEGVNFFTQETMRDEKGNLIKSDDGHYLRPDVIIRLDEGRSVVVDSKMSMTAFFDFVNAEDEITRSARLADHIKSIEAHVNELSKKDYSQYIEKSRSTMNYVIMFVPNSNALWVALNEKPTLWREAMDKNVFIADEQTLYAALRLINLMWIQNKQVANQQKVFDLATQMISRVELFYKHYENVGDCLVKAQKAYFEGQKKLEDKGASIVKTAHDLTKLGAKGNKEFFQKFDFDDDIEVKEIAENQQNETFS